MAWSYAWDDENHTAFLNNPDLPGIQIDVVALDEAVLGDRRLPRRRAQATAVAEVITTALNVLDAQEWEQIEDLAFQEAFGGTDED